MTELPGTGNGNRNGVRNIILAGLASFGGGIILAGGGWVLGTLVHMTEELADVKSNVNALLKHDDQQDGWIGDQNRKMDSNQADVRRDIGHVSDLLYDVQKRLDGKSGSRP